MPANKSVVGIDPSFRGTGLAGLSSDGKWEYQIIGSKGLTMAQTVRSLLTVLRVWIDRGTVVSLESPVANRFTPSTNIKLAYIHGAILTVLVDKQCPYMYIAPVQLRSFLKLPKGKKASEVMGFKGPSDHVDAQFLAIMGIAKAFPDRLKINADQRAIIERIKMDGR